MDEYICLVIGSGPSSEPVIHHLSQTNLSTLVVDGDNLLHKKKSKIDNKKRNINRYTPKQKLVGIENVNSNQKKRTSLNNEVSCSSFLYTYTKYSGGLSNFWGGMISEWSEWEIKKATSLPLHKIKKSYLNLKKRLTVLNRKEISSISPIGKFLINNSNSKLEFSPSIFLLNKKSKNVLFKNDPFNQSIIWNSRETIIKYLKNKKSIKYRSKTRVLSIVKNNGYYHVILESNRKIVNIKAKNIFLCAGTVNSSVLVFGALNKNKVELNLKHNQVFICPLISFQSLNKDEKNYLFKKNLEFSELNWSFNQNLKHNFFISGFYLTPIFIIKKIISIKLSKFIDLLIRKVISNLISRIGFLIFYISGDFTNTKIEIIKTKNKKNDFSDFKIHINSKNEIKNVKKLLDQIKINLPKKTRLLDFFLRKARNGADIHYACTMPEKSLMKSSIQTNRYGEIIGLDNVYSCDPSRLSYLSSKSHTFTSMAITDASMEFIVKKIITKNK